MTASDVNAPRVHQWFKRNSQNFYAFGDDFWAVYGGRNVRYYGKDGFLDIGEADFDRWANSLESSVIIQGNGNIPKQVNAAIASSVSNGALAKRAFNKMMEIANDLSAD